MHAKRSSGSQSGGYVAFQDLAGRAPATIEVRSSAFAPRRKIPGRFTAYGEGISPPLSWRGVPAGTRSQVLIVEDPDAPTPEPFVHWLMYNIPPESRSLPEGIPPKPRLDDPRGAVQGVNSRGSIGYFGPEPPRGDPPHHYHFQIFALDTRLPLPRGVDRHTLGIAMDGHVRAKGDLVGTVQKK